LNGKNYAVAGCRTDRHAAGAPGLAGRTPDYRPNAGCDPLRAARNALPRERRVCYRKLAPSAALSLWKTDLDQFVDTATPSPRGLDPGGVMA